MGAAIVALLIACASSVAAADDGARALAAGCRSCHQPGESVIAALDGQTRETLTAKLRAFRDGALSGTVMPQLAKGYTDAQLEAIARYFAESDRPR
jgi:cytochrome c553